MSKLNQKNAFLEVVKQEKNGKVFNNLKLSVELQTGEIVTFKVRYQFYNSKFNYKLIKNLGK